VNQKTLGVKEFMDLDRALERSFGFASFNEFSQKVKDLGLGSKLRMLKNQKEFLNSEKGYGDLIAKISISDNLIQERFFEKLQNEGPLDEAFINELLQNKDL
jgi:hypothetical protein